jgi:hypothetical protein
LSIWGVKKKKKRAMETLHAAENGVIPRMSGNLFTCDPWQKVGRRLGKLGRTRRELRKRTENARQYSVIKDSVFQF